MRILLLAIPMALLAQPAWAHHKPNHGDFFGERPVATRAAPHPCGGVSNSPHENAALQAMAHRCRRLVEQVRASPNDAALRERCDRLSGALTGRRC
ncbi:hypothetical protein [Vitreimonas flagellata]|jgi:hypothetical protein|uniref:hypothetical protein n=1 Tax=Vitreimonas flagellata TaxID=2560861 RepID=UPI001074B544|nr:hypothetical protein [Vitreimonas flagellata]